MIKRLSVLIAAALCLQLAFAVPVRSAPENEARELNFVFLHGAGGNTCALQFLADALEAHIPEYISQYERANPGTSLRYGVMARCYPNDVDIITWANNITSSINDHFKGKKNLILIGHSMGGKAALYAVARNLGGLAEKTAAVITLNSPIKNLDRYQFAGGGSVYSYCAARWLASDRGLCESVARYDSSEDGQLVARNKLWLALVSSEGAPLSRQFDYGGVDPYPRDMDDGLVPISAQYSEDADVVYYGEHGHTDFELQDVLNDRLAGVILSYIFDRPLQFSVFARSGSIGHQAGWLLGTDYWQDLVGDAIARSGQLWHWNGSYTSGQEWEDVLEPYYPSYETPQRSRYETRLVRSASVLTSIEELRWLEPDDPYDLRLLVRTRAAPRNYIQVDWTIFEKALLPEGLTRDRYEVEIVSGTPLTDIRNVSWTTGDPADMRLNIWSRAERPFRRFKAEWRLYYRETRQTDVLERIFASP